MVTQPVPVAIVENKPEEKNQIVAPVAAIVPEIAVAIAAVDGDEPKKAERKPRAPSRRKATPKPIVADLASVGLEMVETHPEKIAAVITEEPAPRKTPKRSAAWQKKAAEKAAAEEPLVMVETQKS